MSRRSIYCAVNWPSTSLQAGEIDFAPGLTQTPASLRLWLFSDPYMRVPQLVVGPRTGTMAPA